MSEQEFLALAMSLRDELLRSQQEARRARSSANAAIIIALGALLLAGGLILRWA